MTGSVTISSSTIEKPDIRGDKDDSDDPSDDQNQPGDDSGTSGTDVDSDIMSDYTGTDTVVGEDETDNDTSGDIPPNENPDVDPGDIIGGGQNTGAIKLYDVPLSAAKQSYAMQMAEEFGIPSSLSTVSCTLNQDITRHPCRATASASELCRSLPAI